MRVRGRKAIAGGIALVGITAVLSLPASAQTALQPGDRAITVTPSTNLTDGQTVTVAWTGFTPNSKVTVVQCADAAGLKSETCNTGAALFDQDAGPEGEGSVQLTVHVGQTGPDAECSPTGNNDCVIAANEDLRDGITAVAAIKFAAPAADSLAVTGTTTLPLAIGAVGAVLVGFVLVRQSRRRHLAHPIVF